MRGCQRAALVGWNAPAAGPAEFRGNVITVPAAAPGASYGPVGILAGDATLRVRGNTILGAPAALSTTTPLRQGLDFRTASLGGGGPEQVSGNSVSDLDEGLAVTTNDYDGSELTITKNTFRNNAAAVVAYPWGNQNLGATVTATIRCNSFLNEASSSVSSPVGIWLRDRAVIKQGLNEPQGNGNEFPPAQWSAGAPLQNENTSTANQLKYTRLNSASEALVSVGTRIVVTTDMATPVQNACGGTAPGVNSRPAFAPALAAGALQVILDSLRSGSLTALQQAQLLSRLRSQPAQAAQLPSLEDLLTAETLVPLNRLAVGLHLLRYYRTQPDGANADRLRGWLQQHGSTDTELLAYLALTQATDQLGSFLPGRSPLAAATRSLLSRAATPGTTSAPLACRLLRAYEPTCACRLPAAPATQQSALVARPAVGEQVVEAYPNPATGTLHVAYVLPAGTTRAELRAYNALGQVVLRQLVTGTVDEVQVPVHAWLEGLYQFVLVSGGQVLGQQRVVVKH